MYNLEELNRKEKEELLNIAAEMGIKNADKMDDITLRLTIIDEQATNFASSAAAEKTPRKRSRVSIKNVDRVYTANNTKAKKVDKNMKITKDESLFADLSDEEKAMLTAEEPEAAPVAVKEEEAAEPKKRGRKPKVKEEKEAESNEPAAENPAANETETAEPKKRGRKPKVKEEEAPVAETEAPVAEEKNEINVPEETYVPSDSHAKTIFSTAESVAPTPNSTSDFIILQDIPKESDYYQPLAAFTQFVEEPSRMNRVPAAPQYDDYAAAPQPVKKEKPVKERPTSLTTSSA